MKHFTILLLLFSLTTYAQYDNQISGTSNTLNQVDFHDENTGYVGGLSGTLLKTTNGGTLWETLNCPTNERLRSISVVNENVFFFTAGENVGAYYLYKSTDGGNSFQELTIPNNEDPYSVEFIDTQIGFVSARSGGIFKTTNGGNTWYSVSNYNIKSTQFINSQVGYAASVNAIYKSTDGGENWSLKFHSSMANVGTVQFKPMYFSSEGKGHIGSEFYGQLLSTNDAWQNHIYHQFNYTINSIFFTSDLVGYITEYANPENRILKTTDGGVTWNIVYDSFGGLYAQHYESENLGWIVGSSGTILKYEAGLTVEDKSNDLNFEIYPNPGINSIHLKLENGVAESVSVHDISSAKVLEVVNLDEPILIEHLKAGTYFIKLKSSNGIVTKRFIKQ